MINIYFLDFDTCKIAIIYSSWMCQFGSFILPFRFKKIFELFQILCTWTKNNKKVLIYQNKLLTKVAWRTHKSICVSNQIWSTTSIKKPVTSLVFIYRTRAIISRGLYIFYPISKDHFFVFKGGFLRKFCPYVWLVFKSGF